MALHFEDPPGEYRSRQGTDHAAVAAELKAHPGQWAVVSTHPTIQAASTAAGRVKCGFPHAYKPAGAFEAVSRTVDGKHRMYARYTGKEA